MSARRSGHGLPDGVRRAFRLALGGRRAAERRARDVDDEIAFHLAMREARLRAAGFSEAEARAAARRRFGDVDRVVAACRTEDAQRERAVARVEFAGSVWQDVRFAVRALRRAPLTTAAALVTLALGVGATTAIFSVVYGVLVRPLPYREPDRLVQLWETSTSTGADHNPVSVPNYEDWVARTRLFDGMLAYAFNRMTLSGDGPAEQVRGAMLWGDVARTLGVRPMLGRAITRGDAREYVVTLGEGLWRRRFGADSGIVGRSVQINGRAYAVVGVMPASFRFGAPDVELWTGYGPLFEPPLDGAPPWAERRGGRFQRVVARLKPGVTVAAAAAELDAVMRRLAQEYPDDDRGGGAAVVRLRDELVGDVRPALLVLFGAVTCVLLIACANVAHLLLARATARERELAVRAALGAGRGRVVRQLLTESLVLSAAGGALGVPLAFAGVAALGRLSDEAVPRLDAVRVDGWALAFTAAAVVVVGVLVGLAPALRAARRELATTMREAGRGAGEGRRQQTFRSALVSAEVALSLVLLVGAALLLRGYARLRAVDAGVRADGVVTGLVAATPARYPDAERRAQLFARVFERISAAPDVRAVGGCDCLPPDHVQQSGSVLVDGADRSGTWPVADQARVAGSYFAALGIPLLAGRAFVEADRAGAAPVAMVNETFARRLFGARDPARAVGRRVTVDGTTWLTVVGVARDVHYAGLAAAVGPTLYVPLAQQPFPGFYLFVRASGDAPSVIDAVRRTLRTIDPELPFGGARALDDAVRASIAAPRFQTTLLALFGGVALALALVGVYGVVAYGVTLRAREMGVRVALGARRADVQRLVVVQSLRPVALGAVLGLAGAAAGARVLATAVYGADVHDPVIYVAVATALVAAAALAAYVPARRAARADPVEALRGA